MPSPEQSRFAQRSPRRLIRTVLVVALLALVIVPNAAAIRFTDDSYQVPDGAVGSRYFHQFKGEGGCGPALPYQFRILNGALPPGLSLASNGLASGTPTQGGNWSFWVELSDQDPPSADWCTPRKSEREFTINVGPRGSVPDAAGPAASGGGFSVPNPCDLPLIGNVCDAVSAAVTKVAAEAGEFVMRGVTAWVTNAAVWVTGKVGELVEKTTSPNLTADWFEGEYGAMVAVAGALALLMLMLAVIQSVIRQDIGLLVRAAFGYLPMAFILAGVAIAGAGLLVAITDDMSSAVVSSLGTEQSDNLLQAVGDAYKNALEEGSGIPLFGVFLGAIILALGAFVLWLEMIIRDAAIYICVFFLPLTFVAMVWPATSRWARRLVELLVAIILAKFVIVAILTLATAAIANTSVVQGDGNTFEQMLAGSALLVLAAWSPFALLRMIPMMEVAAANVGSQRASMSAAAGSPSPRTPRARTWSAETTWHAMAPSATRSSPRGSATGTARPSTIRCTLDAVTHASGSTPAVSAPANPADTTSAGRASGERPAPPALFSSHRASATAARSGPTPVVSTSIPRAAASAIPRRHAAASVPVAAQTRITRAHPGPGSATPARRA